MLLGYIDQQRQKHCPACDLVGKRAKEQQEGSIFAVYVCPWGHEFEIDRVFEFDMSALSEQIYKQQIYSK
jgi:hypothetical protein